MPEDNKGNAGGGDVKNSGNAGGESGSKKTDTGQSKSFDPSTIGDEDFERIFDDPRLWKHNRFKSLNERAKKADEFEAQKQKEKEAKLLEEKKYQELIAEKDKKINELSGQVKMTSVDSKIILEAQKFGAVDTEAVLKLIDRSNVVIDESGAVSGIAEAVKALLDSKPYLKGSGGNQNIGSGTNPGTGGMPGKYKFKHSQLQDPIFYREHQKEIAEALKNGQIENDL